MRFKPTSAVAFACAACAVIVTSCATDVETDVNIDPAGNALSFAPSVGHSTRATETTISNLGNFAVIARGMHHDGVLYDSFLIGGKNDDGKIVAEIAKRKALNTPENPVDGTWKLDRSVYWPSALEKVLFYAYTALKSDDASDEDVFGTKEGETKPTFGFDGDNPYIDGFKPLKVDVSGSETNGIWADGKDQKDLLVAYTPQERSVSATNVKIDFEHALTQISITAKQNSKADDDNRIVKIKGAWIVNAAESGKLEAIYNKADATITKSWTGTGKTSYGSFYTDIVNLNSTQDQDLLRQYSLMLLPEDLTEWNCKDGTDNNGGAYILLLCRVELKHKGATHEDNANLDDIAIEGGNHYHQLFPVNEDKFNGAEYGFVCVPLSSDWKANGMGKRYTYNLNICGNGTGAGKYPPVLTEDEIAKLIPANTKVAVVGSGDAQDLIVTTFRPSNKNVGDNVLDEPIQFTVTVKGWEEPEDWTDGNIKL